MEPWLAITGALVCVLSLGYSLWVLFQIKKSKSGTRMISTVAIPVSKRNFLLELIALRVPEVQAFLAKNPPHLFLAIRETGQESSEEEATLTSSNEAEGKVTINLTKRTDIEPLVRALLNRRQTLAGGGDLWRKKRNRRKRKQHSRSDYQLQEANRQPNDGPEKREL